MLIQGRHIGKLFSTSCDILQELQKKAFSTSQDRQQKSGGTVILPTSHALTQLDRAGATSSSQLTGQSAGKAHCFLQQLSAPAKASMSPLLLQHKRRATFAIFRSRCKAPPSQLLLSASTLTASLPWTWSTILSTTPGASTFRRDITL